MTHIRIPTRDTVAGVDTVGAPVNVLATASGRLTIFENPAALIVVDQLLQTAMLEPRDALLSTSHDHLLAQP